MAACMWQKLPPEVVENITQYLDIETIKSLRLVDKNLGIQASGPRFRSFIKHQTTILTDRSLRNLHDLATHPYLGSAVQVLKIRAIVYAPSRLVNAIKDRKIAPLVAIRYSKGLPSYRVPRDEEIQALTEDETAKLQLDLDWVLSQRENQETASDQHIVMSLTSALKAFGKLRCIELDSKIVLGPDVVGSTETWLEESWQYVWVQASRTYRRIMTAIIDSRVVIGTLNIFSNTRRCSLPSCDITAHLKNMEQYRSTIPQIPVERLALSFSAFVETDIEAARARYEQFRRGQAGSYIPPFDGRLDENDPKAIAEDNFPGVAQLLSLMPNLKKLHLDFFNTLQRLPRAYDKLFTEIGQNVHLQHLENLRLGGLWVTAESLLQFLNHHLQIKDLELDEIYLTSGKWLPIYKHLEQRTPALTRLRLSSLWTGDLEHLYPVWKSGDPALDLPPCEVLSYKGGDMVITCDFDADEIAKGLSFHPPPTGLPLRSIGAEDWWRRQKRAYGPPTQVVRESDARD